MNFRPIKKEYLDHDPIYRFLRRPQKGPRKSFMLYERGAVEKVSLFEEHFYGDKLLAFFFRPKVYKFLKAACYPGLILITIRLIMSSIELAQVVYKNVGVFLDEKSNRYLFEIFTELEVIAILRDFLKYEAVVFGANFDDLWCFFALSSHPKVIADIRRQKSYLTIQFIVLTFIDAAMIIGAQFLYLSMRGWRLYLNLSTKFGLIWGHFLYPFLIYDIQIVSLFLAKGYSYIGWSLKAASERAKDAHQAELINAKWITYYQNLYELLTDLTDQFDGIKSFFMNIFYLTVAPKVVTVIYDILFTGMKYKLFHFGELVLAVLRIQVITLYVSLIYQSASSLWKEVYEVSLAKDDLGLFIQTNLFMKRITQREVGIKILGFYIIQPSIGPTMVTLVVAYFVAIVSLQFKDGNHGHDNLTMIIPLDKLNQSKF